MGGGRGAPLGIHANLTEMKCKGARAAPEEANGARKDAKL